MTRLQFWIPFVGMRDVPAEVVEAVGLRGKYEGFCASWLGYTILFAVREKGEQEQV